MNRYHSFRIGLKFTFELIERATEAELFGTCLEGQPVREALSAL